MAKVNRIDMSNVKVTFDPNGPSIREWLHKEIKRWAEAELGCEVRVDINWATKDTRDIPPLDETKR